DGKALSPPESWGAAEPAVEGIRPAVVRTHEFIGMSLAARDLCGMMGAYVVKRAQFALAVADDDVRLVQERAGEEVAGPRRLVEPADRLPRIPQHGGCFELEEIRLDIPRGRRRCRRLDRGRRVETSQFPRQKH